MTTPAIPAWQMTDLDNLSSQGQLSGISPTVLGSIDQAESSGNGGGINSSGYGGFFGLSEDATYPGQTSPTTPGLLRDTSSAGFMAQAKIAAAEFSSLLSKAGGDPVKAEQAYQGGGTEGSTILSANLGSASPYAGVNAIQSDATTTGLDANPFNLFGIPGEVGSAAGSAAGAAGSAAVQGATSVLGALITPLKQYIEDGTLIVMGLVIIIVGLVVIAHAGLDAAHDASSSERQTREKARTVQKTANRYRRSNPKTEEGQEQTDAETEAVGEEDSGGSESKGAEKDAAAGVKSGEEVAAVAA